MGLPRAKPVVVIDTREPEHTAYRFDPDAFGMERRKLDAGDYSLAGFESRWGIERKELNDYVASISVHRDRFLREMDRFSSFEFKCIVVEGDWRDVWEHHYHAMVHPNAVAGATYSLLAKSGVQVFFAGDRDYAQKFVADVLLKLWETEQAKRKDNDNGQQKG